MHSSYDALLVVAFGGPEGPNDVMPFLENVLAGRNVPRARMLEVAEHYHEFGGISPINAQNRALIRRIEAELIEHGLDLPVYFGNRNWHPTLTEALTAMAKDGVQSALAFFTTAYSSYSSCRQYRENIAAAQSAIGAKAPEVHKLRAYFNHPGFIQANVENLRAALALVPSDQRDTARILFTAHSLPEAMAMNCAYERQLMEACRLVVAGLDESRESRESSERETGHSGPTWELVYQSRSGPPSQPWLEPDINERMAELAADGLSWVVVHPVGFVSDHMEVMYDLDIEARETSEDLGLRMVRSPSVGTHPLFVQMVRELVEERLHGADRRSAGRMGPSHDVCPADCCLYVPERRAAVS